jgi:hypothetical protein
LRLRSLWSGCTSLGGICVDVVVEGDGDRVTDPATVARLAQAWVDQGWPMEPDVAGTGLIAPFNSPGLGASPWDVHRITPRVASSRSEAKILRFRRATRSTRSVLNSAWSVTSSARLRTHLRSALRPAGTPISTGVSAVTGVAGGVGARDANSASVPYAVRTGVPLVPRGPRASHGHQETAARLCAGVGTEGLRRSADRQARWRVLLSSSEIRPD